MAKPDSKRRGLHTFVFDVLHTAVQMFGSFGVYYYHIRAGIGKIIDILLGIVDHQVTVKKEIGDLTDLFNDRRAKGQIRYKGTVHHVDMHQSAPAVSIF